MYRVLFIIVLLIIYGSLYPWSFHAVPSGSLSTFWHAWPGVLSRATLRDAMVNLVLYAPVGMFGAVAFHRRGKWASMAGPVLLAGILSTGIELAQLFDDSRTSSSLDVACNMAGAACGMVAGRLYAGVLFRSVQRAERALARAPASGLLVFLCWLGYQTFPLFPVVSRTALLARLESLLRITPLSVPAWIGVFIEWTAVACLLEHILGAAKVRTAMLGLILLLLPLKLVLLYRALTLPEIASVALAYVAWNWGLARSPRRTLLAGGLVIAGLILLGLTPYRWNGGPAGFSWVPFRAFFEVSPDSGFVVFFRKCFWYGAAVWLLHRAGCGLARSAAGVALLLGGIEMVQRYLPGRVAEITDPVLAALLAAIMALLERHERDAAARTAA